ncbi:hypothetical protein TWF696_000194 [Orbilia brochopaga]|uniref:Apple domain-containing protein n=1 Tax=Orbilia brochopaga TaxID=3140254 RepID=A0AAV9VBT4_9PEZI
MRISYISACAAASTALFDLVLAIPTAKDSTAKRGIMIKRAARNDLTTNFIPVFKDLTTAVPVDTGLISSDTHDTYDPVACATVCLGLVDPECVFFNIFVLATPESDPASVNTCQYYSQVFGIADATVADDGTPEHTISQSSGYRKIPDSTEFTEESFNDASIAAPASDNDPYMGCTKSTGTTEITKDDCIAKCVAKTQDNSKNHVSADNTYRPCNFVNVYQNLLDGEPDGWSCCYYTQSYGVEYATNKESWDTSDPKRHKTKANSYGYSLEPQLGADGVVTLTN